MTLVVLWLWMVRSLFRTAKGSTGCGMRMAMGHLSLEKSSLSLGWATITTTFPLASWSMRTGSTAHSRPRFTSTTPSRLIRLKGQWFHERSQPQNRGAVYRIHAKSREIEYIAGGFRTPNGIGVSTTGEVYVADNQGAWLPRASWCMCNQRVLRALQRSGFQQALSKGIPQPVPRQRGIASGGLASPE